MRLPARLLRRKPSAHKGDFGHVLILAGSARFSGAAVLCAEAAIRSGAGLVTLGIPEGLNAAIVKIKPREVMTLPLARTGNNSLSSLAYNKIKDFSSNVNVLVIGPGLGQDESTQVLVRKIISRINKPMVIDADALNALSGHLSILHTTHDARRTTILTPHPGEMARLLGVSVKQVQNNREKFARSFALENKVTLVLKGHHTVVAAPKNKLYINKTGNPGMATAGSGDVLSGVIAALLAQGLDAFEAAKYGAYLHGLAGDIAAREKTEISLIAGDIIDKIPKAIKRSS